MCHILENLQSKSLQKVIAPKGLKNAVLKDRFRNTRKLFHEHKSWSKNRSVSGLLGEPSVFRTVCKPIR